jgi:signal transduction histidine kinase
MFTIEPRSIIISESDLERMAEGCEQISLSAGEELFAEGSPGDYAYIVREGTLQALKHIAGRQMLLAEIGRGELIGEMALLQNRPRMATVVAKTDAVLYQVNEEQFNHVLDTCPPVARAVLQTVLERWRNTEARTHQDESLSRWGQLTAGVAHELNNPASAVQRGVDQLRDVLEAFMRAQNQVSEMDFSPQQQQIAGRMFKQAVARAEKPRELDALARSDREAEIEAVLEAYGQTDAWEYAPVLVDLDVTGEELNLLAAQFNPEQLQLGLRWLCSVHTTYSLLAEIMQGARQISSIVTVLKGYSYLDQAPIQQVDVHEGIDNTLLILRHRIPPGLSIRREYASELPLIMAYGRELNQVWTNIINNAISALDGQGTIVIRTRLDTDHNWVVVEIEDDGPGIPEEVQPNLFAPFVTTKEPGEGTGLGLNISYNIVVQRHRGEILVNSEPGRTVFTIRLPFNCETVE